MTFPADFIWGAATASYQIEGAALEDGRGECIWTRFSHTPGKIANGDTGDVACDHYHRYKEDVALMKEIGLKGYRFSISWPRVIPLGVGATNPAGLDFYNRLVDELLEAGIEPYLTLYHWDLPQALQDNGGWESRDIVQQFADYTALMTQILGDRVKYWTTHNEPHVVAFAGNFNGQHAPGNKSLPTALLVAHHLLLAHAESMAVIRQTVPGASAGIVLNYHPMEPASDSPADIQAAAYADGNLQRWFLDPVFKGHYPQDMVELYGEAMDGINVDEVIAAQVPIDYLGLNYYTHNMIMAAPEGSPSRWMNAPIPGKPVTAMGWEIYPPGLADMLLRVHQDYSPKAIYIMENGSAFDDPAPNNGVVQDPERTAYLVSHLKAMETAIDAGVPVKGYFAWSLMDNFEWALGFGKRFGIIHVDYATQTRTLKATALRYQQVIQANAVVE
jgi:beta-glucosidase